MLPPLMASTHRRGAAPPAVFSIGNKKSRLVSIHSESIGVTGVFEVRPVLEGSGRDADPSQRQLLGPSVITKMIGPQRIGGGQRLQPVFCIVCQASIARSALVAANAAVVAAHLVAAIASSERSAAHDRGNVVFGGFLQPPSNGFSSDRWALITALTP